MVDVTKETEPTELERTRLNAFIRFAINQQKISTASLLRLTELVYPSQPERPLIEPDIETALPNLDLPEDIPLSPSLRVIGDFAIGQNVNFFHDMGTDFQKHDIQSVDNGYVKLSSMGKSVGLLHYLVAPFYVGLIDNSDYLFYQEDHPHKASTTNLEVTHIYVNTELAVILGRVGLFDQPDIEVIKRIRRKFGSTGKGYKPQLKHIQPIQKPLKK